MSRSRGLPFSGLPDRRSITALCPAEGLEGMRVGLGVLAWPMELTGPSPRSSSERSMAVAWEGSWREPSR
eukprot:CAMPEP_0173309658 /NCGR_PEP_ID=MMETSP1143-20121109/22457_1 /TAXON_ID=483371 /ORGANISM="non described non described, Strain CCMP2298" /LENGTH=69 /DNA_ID=CAMNT_0014251283 /DNA_START=291 /DNA_END=500 /DNA_ORIENTATION=-